MTHTNHTLEELRQRWMLNNIPELLADQPRYEVVVCFGCGYTHEECKCTPG